jgi:hypothetical protein
MNLHPSAYEPYRLQEPEDLIPLALGAKWGQIYGIEPGTYLDKRTPSDYRTDPWEWELGDKAVAIASRFGVRLRKWLEAPEHAVWLDGPIRDENQDLLMCIEWFSRKRFTVEVAYVLSLDWYAPHGWLSPLIRLAACADDLA